MTIRLNCPACHHTMRFSDDALGKRARCSQCNQVITIPPALTPAQAGPSTSLARPTPPDNDSFTDLPPLTSTGPALPSQPIDSLGATSSAAHNPYSADANPYAVANQPYAAPNATGASAYGPGLSLMILAGIHLAIVLMFLFLNMIGWAFIAMDLQGNEMAVGQLAVLIMVQLGLAAVQIGSQGTVFMGGKAMLDHRNRGLAYAGAIISLIPCIGSSLFIFGVPFGVWALIVLSKPEVQRRFN